MPQAPRPKRQKKGPAAKQLAGGSSVAGSVPDSSCREGSQGGAAREVAVKLEQMAGQGAGVEPDDSTSTSPAQEAAKARLDDLYRVFEMFQNRGTRDAGYTSLTRGSLEAIFHRLIDSYDFTDNSVFVDLGAGVGRVLWHASFAVNSRDRPVGIEMCQSLQAEAEELEQMVTEGTREASIALVEGEEGGTPEISFQDISSFSAHDYATHIFMFWDSFSLHSKRAAGQIFCKSPCAGFLVVVQPGDAQEPGATLDFDASIKLVERMETGIQVEGSNDARIAYIYQKALANGN